MGPLDNAPQAVQKGVHTVAQQPQQPFDPDQFKQDVLNSVQQALNAYAAQQAQAQPPNALPAQPPVQQYYLPYPPGYNAPMPPNAPSPIQQAGQMQPPQYYQPYQGAQQSQYQPGAAAPFPSPMGMPQAQQPVNPYALQPVQPMQPMVPQGQPTMEQLVQGMITLFQRQEELFTKLENLQGFQQAVPSVPPYPYAANKCARYRWLMDYGLQCEKNGSPRPVVTQQHINDRRRELQQLEMSLSFAEYRELVQDGYHGWIFEKF